MNAKPPFKLTLHDHDLIHGLWGIKQKHLKKARHYETLKKAEMEKARQLSIKNIAEKFDVKEPTIRRILKSNV